MKFLSCHLSSVQWHLKNHRLLNCLLRDQIMLSIKLTRSVILDSDGMDIVFFFFFFWEFRRFYFLLKADLTLTLTSHCNRRNSIVLNVQKCTGQREQMFEVPEQPHQNPLSFGMHAPPGPDKLLLQPISMLKYFVQREFLLSVSSFLSHVKVP